MASHHDCRQRPVVTACSCARLPYTVRLFVHFDVNTLLLCMHQQQQTNNHGNRTIFYHQATDPRVERGNRVCGSGEQLNLCTVAAIAAERVLRMQRIMIKRTTVWLHQQRRMVLSNCLELSACLCTKNMPQQSSNMMRTNKQTKSHNDEPFGSTQREERLLVRGLSFWIAPCSYRSLCA